MAVGKINAAGHLLDAGRNGAQTPAMSLALRAAVMYFVLVFAAGFVLGTIRTLWLAPALGEATAVLAELPVMLVISWAACGAVLKRLPVPPAPSYRLFMGLAALTLLLAAEALLSITLGGLTLQQYVALYRDPPALLGLGGQVIFGLFPFLRR